MGTQVLTNGIWYNSLKYKKEHFQKRHFHPLSMGNALLSLPKRHETNGKTLFSGIPYPEFALPEQFPGVYMNPCRSGVNVFMPIFIFPVKLYRGIDFV